MNKVRALDNFTREFYSWEHAFNPYLNQINDSNSIKIFNFITKTGLYCKNLEPPPVLSKVDLFSSFLKLEDFKIISTLGKI